MNEKQLIANRIAQAVLSYRSGVSFEHFGKQYLGYNSKENTYSNEFEDNSLWLKVAEIVIDHEKQVLEGVSK